MHVHKEPCIQRGISTLRCTDNKNANTEKLCDTKCVTGFIAPEINKKRKEKFGIVQKDKKVEEKIMYLFFYSEQEIALQYIYM
jgi:hypothetical protein